MRKDFLKKEDVIEVKSYFFNCIVEHLMLSPTEIDFAFNQDIYYVEPHQKSIFNSPSEGTLFINVFPEFFDKMAHYAYSIYLTGTKLKIGILFYDDAWLATQAANGQEDNEIQNLFPEVGYSITNRDNSTLLEWSFDLDKEFYHSYEYQDRFVLNMRHLHFRILKMIYTKNKNQT